MTSDNADSISSTNTLQADLLVGRNLKTLRTTRGYSLRALAECSGLNVNTLSLIENGKSSPSVSTLQQLALALHVQITDFFEAASTKHSIVFTPGQLRPQERFGTTCMQDLAREFSDTTFQPYIVTIQPGMGSGDQKVLHSGLEFVYCINGALRYQIGQQEYQLNQGDSLVFEAHLPHCWENTTNEPAEILLVLHLADEREEPGGKHFSPTTLIKEIQMKIAVITDDGKSISRHFGRAQYYAVYTIEEGKVTGKEMRNKLGHNHFHNQEHEEDHQNESHGAGHGMDTASHNRHAGMAEAIADCKALLCGGMGMGAYESMRRLNIEPVVTDIQNIDDAVQAFIDGKIIDHTELLH